MASMRMGMPMPALVATVLEPESRHRIADHATQGDDFLQRVLQSPVHVVGNHEEEFLGRVAYERDRGREN